MKKQPTFDLTIFKKSYGLYFGIIALLVFLLQRYSIDVDAGRNLNLHPTKIESNINRWMNTDDATDSVRTLTYFSYNIADSNKQNQISAYWISYRIPDTTEIGIVLPEAPNSLRRSSREIWTFSDRGDLLGYYIDAKSFTPRFSGAGTDSNSAVRNAIFNLLSAVEQQAIIDSLLPETNCVQCPEYSFTATYSALSTKLKISGDFKSTHQQDVHFEIHELSFVEKQRKDALFQTDESSIIALIGSVILIIAILILGYYRRGMEGALDWKRVGSSFLLMFVMYLSWRFLIYLPKFEDAFSSLAFRHLLSEMVNGLGLAVFLSLAYGTWESLNRKQNRVFQQQLDAIWQLKWFRQEIGEAIANVPMISGALLLTLSGVMYALDIQYYHASATFQAAEFQSPIPSFTLPLSAFISTFVIGTAMLGLTYNVVRDFGMKEWQAIVITTPIASLTQLLLPRFFATTGTLAQDYVMLLAFSAVALAFWVRFGGLSVLISIFFVATLMQLLPLLQAQDMFYLVHGWIVALSWISFFVFGFVAQKFAQKLSKDDRYSPEYEEKMLHQMRISNEIQIAAESQFSLMPHHAPTYKGAEIAGFFAPSFEVGGDFYDFLVRKNSDGQEDLFFTIADVSGKGMKAAMQAVYASGLLYARLKTDNPAEALRNVSSVLKDKTDKRTFVTAICAQYSHSNNMLTFSNAGHCLPVIKQAEKVRFVESEGPRFALGIKEEVDYSNKSLTLSSGDVVVFYSDGLNEAVNAQGIRYEYKSLFDLLKNMDTKKLSAAEIAKYIKDDVQTFSNFQMADDTTVICLKINNI